MLDEFGAEIEHADSRLDATMKKMAKVLHLSDGKCIPYRHCYLNIFEHNKQLEQFTNNDISSEVK